MDTTNKSPLTLTGDWEAQSKELKTKYTQLTDTDLKLEPGGERELIGRVKARLNKNHDEVVEILRAGQIEKK